MAQDLCLDEREEIRACLSEDPAMAWSEIARRVGRHRTTIAREVERNGGRGAYRAAQAQRRKDRLCQRVRPTRLQADPALAERVRDEIEQGRSPYAISVDLKADPLAPSLCHETIYRGVYRGDLGDKAKQCLRTRRTRRHPRKPKTVAAKPFATISSRPEEVNDRSQAGHWEADLIIGAGNKSGMLFTSERVSRIAIGRVLPYGYTADLVQEALESVYDTVPAHLLKSLTLDQGSEWANWKDLCDEYGIDVYFCDPHAPWQRGQIENQNRIWRYWFPRGIRLDTIPQHRVDEATAIINNQPRRLLHNNTPAKLYTDLTVH